MAYELWQAGRAARQMTVDEYGIDTSKSLFQRVLLIFVESAALYSLNNLFFLIFFARRSLVEGIFSTLVSTSDTGFTPPDHENLGRTDC